MKTVLKIQILHLESRRVVAEFGRPDYRWSDTAGAWASVPYSERPEQTDPLRDYAELLTAMGHPVEVVEIEDEADGDRVY